MKSILIVGGSGILSAAVVKECIDNGWQVTMINRGNNRHYIHPQAELLQCDVNNIEKIHTLLDARRFDVCIDFIVFKLEHLKRSLSSFGKIVDQYVFISSAQVYNTSISGVKTEESETPQKLWSYSVNKDACEHYLKEYCTQEQINYTIIRPGVNYDNRRIPYGMGPRMGAYWTMVERIKHGKPIIIWNDGENKLNLTRVEDFARGLIGILGNSKTYNETFNVVGDEICTWKEALDVLGNVLKTKIRIINVPVDFYASYLIGEPKEMLLGGRACDLVCSNEKLKKTLPGFQTKYDLVSGIKATIDHMVQHPDEQDIDYNWDADMDVVICEYLKKTYQPKDKTLRFVNYGNLQFNECLKLRLQLLKRRIKRNNSIRKLFGK